MAEGLLRYFCGDKYEVFSAGATPTKEEEFVRARMFPRSAEYSRHIQLQRIVLSEVDLYPTPSIPIYSNMIIQFSNEAHCLSPTRS